MIVGKTVNGGGVSVKLLNACGLTQLGRAVSTLVYDDGDGAALELKGRKEHRRLRMQNYKF